MHFSVHSIIIAFALYRKHCIFQIGWNVNSNIACADGAQLRLTLTLVNPNPISIALCKHWSAINAHRYQLM